MLTGLKLHLPRPNIHQQLHHRVRRAEHLIEQNKPNHHRPLHREPERPVQTVVPNENTEQAEHPEEMRARYRQERGGVSHLPVPQLVREDSLNLRNRRLLDQRVVNDDLLLPGQAGEVGVAVRAPLTPIDDLQLRERELETLRQPFDFVFERAGLEGREFVEQGHDEYGVDRYGTELDEEREEPDPEEELLACYLDYFEEGCAQGYSEGEREGLAFGEVREPEGEGLFVEAEGFFEDEVVVVAERQA